MGTLKFRADFLNTRFPLLSAFHAFMRAKSPVIASSMMYCRPLNSRCWLRGGGEGGREGEGGRGEGVSKLLMTNDALPVFNDRCNVCT